ncbi:MAG TPA: MMPL family transporter [Candidatus Thermoplasmatota archaeon]|nr:MMPL family transporter [Candidatus Thermoplasmatota archaeon]
MSRLLLAPRAAAEALTLAATGAPRATVAVLAAATLILASLLPQLALVNSEEMWLPKGPRTDAYHGAAAAFGVTEYVGVLAEDSDGNIVGAEAMAALLELEDAALSDPSVAEAFRFPRDPDRNAVSLADLVAEADAVLEHRAAQFEPLAAALAATLNTTGDPASVDRAVRQASQVVALLSAIRELARSHGPQFEHALLDTLLPELQVTLLSGADPAWKGEASALLLAPAMLANWSQPRAPLDPQDGALAAARALVLAASAELLSNATGASKAASATFLVRSFVALRDVLDLDAANASSTSAFLQNLCAALDPASPATTSGLFTGALGELVRALLLVDRLSPVGDSEAVAGVRAMALDLSGLLEGTASREARQAALALFARLFEAFAEMGTRGLDLNVPQSNISYDSYSAALNENASKLEAPGASVAELAAAASNLSLSTTGFLGNLENLNALGIFTDPSSYERVHTMVVFLNDTFATLVELMALPEPRSTLALAASMVSVEVRNVVNTSAQPAHRIDLNASAALAHALRAFEEAVSAGGETPSALSASRAAGWILKATDFEDRGLMPSSEEDLLSLTALTLEEASLRFASGEPPAAHGAFASVARASFAFSAAAPSSGLAESDLRSLSSLLEGAARSLEAALEGSQNPALFARVAGASLALLAFGLASPRGGLEGTAAALLPPLIGSIEGLSALFSSAALSNGTKGLVAAQAFLGADLTLTHLGGVPPPPLPSTRAEAAARLRALGDSGVSLTLSVLLNTTERAPARVGGLPQGDLRFAPFEAAVAASDPGVERALREAHGFAARALLPSDFTASGANVTAKGTLVLFLFNGSLERSALGQRESALRDLAHARASGGVSYAAFGFGLMWYDTQKAMDLSVVLFALTMLLVMGVALYAVYRRPFDVALTLTLLGATVVWVLGTAAMLGIAINPVTQVIPVLLIGLAEDYAVHWTVGYRRKRDLHLAPTKAALGAVLGVGGVLFLATVTNGLSFLSFGGSDLALIKDFGLLLALGLGFSFLLTVTLVPAATVWRDESLERRGAKLRGAQGGAGAPRTVKAPPAGPSGAERALLRAVEKAVRHPWSALAVVALLTAASALGATTLSTTFSYDQITARDLDSVRALNAAQDGYPASIERVSIVVEGRVDEPAVFLALRQAQANVQGDPFVVFEAGRAGTRSIVSQIEAQAALHALEGSAARGYLPSFDAAFRAADFNGDRRLDAADNLTAGQLQAVYDALLSDPAGSTAELLHKGPGGYDRAALQVEAKRAVENGATLSAALEADAAPLRDPSLSASVTAVSVSGLALLNREVMEAVVESGWQSVLWTLVAALVILTVFFFAAFRSLALGALTIAPTLIAVAWTLGAMVLAGLSLNMMTVMIATTTVGMGDLYAIHISYSFYRELRRHKDPVQAADEMVREAGAPLLEASATTALGFLILVAAPVPVVQSYGLIFAASIVFAFLYSILVMPVLVLLLARATGAVGRDAVA